MTPTDFHDQQSRRDHNSQIIIPRSPPLLKVNKDSRAIKKSSLPSPPPPSSTTCKQLNSQHHRRPVIIYTHSPKVVQTKPEDFMALVQKLTGFSKDDQPKEKGNDNHDDDDNFNEMDEDNKRKAVNESNGIVDEYEENESSVITEENGGNLGVGEIGHQVNSTPRFLPPPPPILDPITNNPFYSNNIPYFGTQSSADFLVGNNNIKNHGFYNCSYSNDPLLFGSAAQNLRCSIIPSPSTLEALNEFRQH